ncbi:MAG: NAAT family transporter [Gammaproteobacteria bacterium]|nr:NAAT family transporter [Gammaproteobacteria bacterium]
MLEQVIKWFVVMFVVVEPISLVPMFGALTRGGTHSYRRKMAYKATVLSAIIFFAFAFVGDWLLKALAISVDAFKIGGGILLFLLSVDMVFARQSGLRSTTVREQDEARYRDDISVFPLAFPLIAGPGALATLLLLMGEVQGSPWLFLALLGVLLLVLLITLILLLAAGPVMSVLGVTGANVISRLLGVVLVALAVQFVVDGIRCSFFMNCLASATG